MTRSKRFEPIREIASNCADALSSSAAEAARKVAELERQLAQLETYRDEYVRNSGLTGTAIDAVKLQNYRSFLERLGDAMRQQTRNLDAARADFERRRLQWSEKRIEAESLGRAVERFRAEERHSAERHDQRETDDAASLRVLTARGESGNR